MTTKVHKDEEFIQLRNNWSYAQCRWFSPGQRQNAPQTAFRYVPAINEDLYQQSFSKNVLAFLENADRLWDANAPKEIYDLTLVVYY